jgi:hypothetical protein
MIRVLALAIALATPALADKPAFYFDRVITDADLAGKTLRELSLMRNTIFARTGNHFRRKWLNAWFTAQPWYTAREKVDRSVVTALDLANARKVAAAEANQDKAALVARGAEIRARQTAGKATPEDAVELQLISARLGRWVGAPEQAEALERTPFENPSLLDKQLTAAQLANLSRRDLRLLRNMVFARRGYAFKSNLLQMYFDDTDWYRPDPKYTQKKLTRLDWRNVKLIRSVENEHGGALTDWEHKDEEGWFAAA